LVEYLPSIPKIQEKSNIIHLEKTSNPKNKISRIQKTPQSSNGQGQLAAQLMSAMIFLKWSAIFLVY
jgi:hypothetical protein